MKLNFTPKFRNAIMGAALLLCGHASFAQVNTITEGFTALPDDWTIINHSAPIGTSTWFQGNPTVFTAHTGATNSYAGANFNSTAGTGDISDWYLTPVVNIQNGSTISFWTRIPTVATTEYPDRLELRMSTAGSSTNVGVSSSDVGDFTTVLLSVNPTLTTGVYPQVWTQFTATVSGLPAATTGRIAFRYWVLKGGPNGNNSNYIGVDDFSYDFGTLPVTFKNFDGVTLNGQSLLKWTTTNEINNKGFDVERSTDGQVFSPIGFVAGQGKSNIENNYTFTDVKPVNGVNYYRLKQIDNNGQFAYSGTIQLKNVIKDFVWSVYPNPVVDNGWMQVQLPNAAKVSVQIISSTGNIISMIDKGTLQTGTYSIPLNMNTAAKGIYVVKLIVDNKTYSKTIVK
ncbi:MAG: choice-of-anchor J domain-containing protein [Chitinophagaceae bacterium]